MFIPVGGRSLRGVDVDSSSLLSFSFSLVGSFILYGLIVNVARLYVGTSNNGGEVVYSNLRGVEEEDNNDEDKEEEEWKDEDDDDDGGFVDDGIL